MKIHPSSRLLLTASMIIFGTLGLFTRNISLSSGELALYRAVLAAALILVYLTVTGQSLPIGTIRRELPLLIVSGMAMGINWVLLFQAYRFTTISMATLSYYFAPVIVIVACPILFREKMTPRQLICFVMSTAGLVLIIGAGGAGNGTDLIGVLFGLGAAVFYATVILMNKFIRQVTGIHRTLIQFGGAILILLPYVALTGGFHLGSLDGRGWICMLIVGLGSHRHHLLHVLLLPERFKRAGDCCLKLHGPSGGNSHLRSPAGRAHDSCPGSGRGDDPGLHSLE